MKKDTYRSPDSYERILHWMLAISCLLLCLTGLGMMFQTFNLAGLLFGGLKSLKLVHNFTGLVFAVSLILVIRLWWKEAGSICVSGGSGVDQGRRGLPVACG